MNSGDVKQLLDRALPPQWEASGATSDAAISGGKRLRRCRRATAGGGLALGVVTLAALTAFALTPGASQKHTQAADGGHTGVDCSKDESSGNMDSKGEADCKSTKPKKPPRLDPNKPYHWTQSWQGENDATKSYEKKLINHLKSAQPDLLADNEVHVKRITERLHVGDKETDKSVVYERNAYSISVGAGSHPDSALKYTDGALSGEVEIKVYAAGTFDKKYHEDWAQVNIQEYPLTLEHYIDGDGLMTGDPSSDGSGGTFKVLEDFDAKGGNTLLNLVNYREDGSGVVVADDVRIGPGDHKDEATAEDGAIEPGLDEGETQAIAASLPNDPVT